MSEPSGNAEVALAPLLDALGRPTPQVVDGRRLVDLASESVRFVVEGELGLFLQPLRADGQLGGRHRWLSLPAGSLLPGIPLSRMPDGVALIGAGLPGTTVVEVGSDQLRRALAGGLDEVLAAFGDAVGNWSRALAEQMPDVYRHGPLARIIPGEPIQLDAGESASPVNEMVWVLVDEGSYTLAGASGRAFDADDVVLPISPPLYLRAITPTRLSVVDPSDTGLAEMYLGVTRLLELGLALHAELVSRTDDALKDRRAVDERRNEEAIRTLASVLGATPTARLSIDPTTMTRLQIAFDRVGAVLGVDFPRISDLPPHGTQDALGQLADAAHVRVRRVGLTDRWWTETSGPLVVFCGDEHRPVAVVPRSSRRYRWYDSDTAEWRAVDADFARSAQPVAVSFYDRLPDGELTMPKLVRFALRGAGGPLRIVFAFGFLVALLSLVVPLVTKVVFDRIIPDGSTGLLLSVTAMFTGAALTIAALSLTESLATLRTTGLAQASLQPALWDRLLRLPGPFFRRYTTGDLANRADGVDQMRQVLTGQALASVLSVIFSLVSVGLLFVLSWQLALVVVPVLIVLAALLIGLNLWRVRYIRKVMMIRGSISGLVFQLLESVPKIRVAGAEDRALRAWAEAYRPQIQAGYTAGLIEAWLQGIGGAASAVVALFAYWMAGTALLGISPGTFLAFSSALGMVVAAITTFNTQLSAIAECVPLYERFLPITQSELENSPEAAQPGELSGRIEIEGVSFRYEENGPLILDNVSLAVEPGEFVAITGPSGAGKSTLVQLLLGFEEPDSGHVLFDGKDVAALDRVAVRRQIGAMLQHNVPATGPISRVILGDSGGTLDDAWRAAEAADIAGDIRAMPMGMNTLVTEGGSTFSGGQIQRIGIARAIARRPRIMLMDEATSALDNRTQAQVSQALDALSASRIVIAHRLSTIRDADRIVVLQRGRVVQTGTYDQLMAQAGLFRDLARRQLPQGHEEPALPN